MRLLLVEDEPRLAQVVARRLAAAGYVVDIFPTAAEAEAALAVVRYDLLVLDLGLPDGDGMQVLRRLRASGRATPVLILTARDDLESRVAGLDGGADDYLVKPFEMPELLARIKAVLRRPAAELGGTLSLGRLSLEVGGGSALLDGKPMLFSRRELALLENLMRRAGNVVTRQALEAGIYGFDDEIGSNSLEVLVHRLRRRLTDAGAGVAIHTVRGLGYILSEAA